MYLTVSGTPDNMGEVTRIGDLYDFYGAFLTNRQREIMEMYHVEDWSLGEIAQSLQISRQAVHDQLRRAADQLEQYEAVLQLASMAQRQRDSWQKVMLVWAKTEALLADDAKTRMEQALRDFAETLAGLTGGDAGA